ncbi:MAG: 15-cis-phytoene desaturase [Cyanobacteria bacterium J06642_2]
MRVAIAGGGLAGLACAKYLCDRGIQPVVYERRDVLGGLVAAWQDEEGDWYETGLHVFFGAYPNMIQLMKELDISERLQWKEHTLIFNQPDKPGTYSRFDHPSALPAPLNAIVAILRNNDMLSWSEKIELAIGLGPAMLRGQKYVEDIDKYTLLEWLRFQGVSDRVNTDVFIAASKALAFINPDDISATVPLTALNRFLQEKNGSKVAFLDGSPTERLCQPIVDYIEARGGEVCLNAPLKEIVTNADSSVSHFIMRGLNGQPDWEVRADAYVSALSVDPLKAMLPSSWREVEFFQKLQQLEGVPVINIHLWFDRKLTDIDHLLFSRSDILSVYADMSNTCREYENRERSMLELILAPAADYIAMSEAEIVDVTMKELARLFPGQIPAPAKLLKTKVVKTPRSVYNAVAGTEVLKPTQITPIDNFFLVGSYTKQRFLGSMEGAVCSGKVAAHAIADRQAQLVAKSGAGSRNPAEIPVAMG